MEPQQYQHGQHQNGLYGGMLGEAQNWYDPQIGLTWRRNPGYAFPYDQFFVENFTGATNQKPILTNDDQDSMTNFFENPDQASVFGYAFTHDDSSEEQPVGASNHRQWNFNSSNGVNQVPASMAGAYSSQGNVNVSALSGQSGLPVTSGEWSRQLQQPMMNNEDFHAASFLHTLRGQQQLPDGSPAMEGGNFGNASWGSFAVAGGGNMHLPSQFRPPNHNGHRATYNANGQQVTPTFGPQDMQQMSWQSPMSHVSHPQAMSQQQQQLQQQSTARARHLSLDTNTQYVRSSPTPTRADGARSAVPPSTEKPRPAPVRFGSDNNFSVHGYHGPGMNISVEQQEKVGNLLGMPLAVQAAKHTRPNSQDNGQARKGPSNSFSPGGIGGLPLISPLSGPHMTNDSWGNMPPPGQSAKPNLDAFFPDNQPRKRRKSKHELEDEAEYVPPEDGAEGANAAHQVSRSIHASGSDDEGEGGKPTSKRPKSGNNVGASFSDRSASPEGGDDDDGPDQLGGKKKARNSKKQRENLSESQKRQNHIQSEKKRRDVINNGYSELSRLVPCLAKGKTGLSRSESLQEIASYLEVLVTSNTNLMGMLGISESEMIAAGGGI